MATWSEVQDHMRSTYRLQLDEPNRLAMSWVYEDDRTQRIIVRKFTHDGVVMVEFKSPFARLGGPDPLELLRENARLPLGACALSGEVFLIVHNAVLGDLSLESFDDLLARVAGIADKLETKHADQDAF